LLNVDQSALLSGNTPFAKDQAREAEQAASEEDKAAGLRRVKRIVVT
jgi:hypothetical protein